MTVYVVVDNQVLEPEPYKEYLRLITPTVEAFGGCYVVRAGTIHFTDSDWKPDRLVIMAFPSAEHAKAWVQSEKTAAIHAMRRKYAVSKLIIIDGVDA